MAEPSGHDTPTAASESGVDGTTAASRLVNEGAEAGVAPGDRQDARPGDTPKVGDVRSAAIAQALDVAEAIEGAWRDNETSDFHEYPWEHLGDAERDVRVLIAGLREATR